jgi:CelD/BcsL family acetyltransferase involved in cellulose biosynthesis/dTDP-4-amino-4,6-dideoxygalactose transaminase
VKPALEVLPPPPFGAVLRRPVEALPFPLEEAACRLYARGRQGLAHGLGTLALEPGDELLVPAYHCGSEVEALTRSGLVSRFYAGDDALEPVESELESLIGPKTRALYVIHYLGFPQDMRRWRRWCDDHGLLLLEDAAPAWLASRDGEPVGLHGDLAIFCLFKTFGLPDGAALLTRGDPPPEGALPHYTAKAAARRYVGWLLTHSRVLAPVYDRLLKDAPYVPEDDFALDDPVQPSASTRFLLPRVADETAAAGRRANYAALREELLEHVSPPFRDLPDGASPFAFPLESAAKGVLLERLADAGVRAVDYWSVPHPTLPAVEFPAAARLRARIVGLPVHQELEPADIERMTRAVLGRRPARRKPLRSEPIEGFGALRDEWNALAERSGNVFATWEWASIWWRHFGEGHELRTVACRDADGALVALLPLYSSRVGPLRLLRFIGHGPGDQLGPICASGDRAAAARALRGVLDEGGWDVFLGEEMPARERWSALLGGRVLRREGSPLLDIARAGSWEDFLGTLSAKTRKNMRYHERRLEREHGLRFRLADDPARLRDDLDTLFRLHRLRWAGDSVFTGRAEPFHRDFAAAALARGWLRLWFLELDGEPVAASHNFRFAGAECDYQGGRDPDWERYSVGFVLLTMLLRKAFEDGLREYRMLRGGEHWKYRFASSDPGLETIGLARGPLGEVALASGRAALGLRQAVRQRRRKRIDDGG